MLRYKIPFILLAVVSISGAAGNLTPIFNGKTLEGWTQCNGSARYYVENGELVGVTAKGSPRRLSTTCLILRCQGAVAQARSTEVVARSDYIQAKTSLRRATGHILEDYNICVEEAYHGRISTPPSPLP